MTDKFINEIKSKYDDWTKNRKKDVEIHNRVIKEQIEKYNRIKELLKDINVQEFAKLIDYKDRPYDTNYYIIDDPMKDFLEHYMTMTSYSKDTKNDNYPIYCYVSSNIPNSSINEYYDVYLNLQSETSTFIIGDKKRNGLNRDIFKLENNIIYPENGCDFLNSDYFYEVQTEYVKNALVLGQKEASKLLIKKYSK